MENEQARSTVFPTGATYVQLIFVTWTTKLILMQKSGLVLQQIEKYPLDFNKKLLM